ncbi:helix-turn-helix transcriptional regulator [Kitasatospora sp. NRRL B-11411]|uniref:helix-turn-helix domain-containing protein n=1 Tax=Kitasatospora sp. NRRL B-11411 TaxID=1463822 RepID=UPI00068F3DBB|nr:helix-turn-helix transcriptional regulator [Kitasatospora sp. NRRL B-11411]
MNTGEHGDRQAGRGGTLSEQEPGGRQAALAELRARLETGLARSGLNKTQLAARTRLGRTTVSEAFSAEPGRLPSARTVAALSAALRLQDTELLDLLERGGAAAGEAALQEQALLGEVGRPIAHWNPYDLEVHPVADTPTASDARAVPPRGSDNGASATDLPGYVRRPHDAVLAEAVAAAASGSSAMVVLVGSSSTGKTRACWEAVQPLSAAGWTLWHPFDPTRAEAALADLERVAPKTVVWLNEAQHYLDADQGVGERVAAAVHTLLTDRARGPLLVLGTLWPQYEYAYTIAPRPGAFDRYSRVRELLAGRLVTVPETFDAAALAEAAALAKAGDRHLADALSRAEDGRLTQDLAGAPELLRRYRNATPGARSLLHAAMDARRLGAGPHLSLVLLTDSAQDYLTDQEFDALTDDWAELALAELAKPVHGDEAPLRRIRHRAGRRPPGKPSPGPLATAGPFYRLADYLEQHGRAERRMLCPPASFWHAVHDHIVLPKDLERLADSARARHRLQWAQHLYQRAADAGRSYALSDLAHMWEDVGDRARATHLAEVAASAGSTYALTWLAEGREEAGDRGEAERLAQLAADAGDAHALGRLAWERRQAGDQAEAARLAELAADAGDDTALTWFEEMEERATARAGSAPPARLAYDSATIPPSFPLHPYERGEECGLQEDYRVAEHLTELEDTGAVADARLLLAIDTRDIRVLNDLARLMQQEGDWAEAERLAHLAVDAGDTLVVTALLKPGSEYGKAARLWPYGLDPDGTPTPPW